MSDDDEEEETTSEMDDDQDAVTALASIAVPAVAAPAVPAMTLEFFEIEEKLLCSCDKFVGTTQKDSL